MTSSPLPLEELLVDFAERPLTVVDVGARWGAADTWAVLSPHVHVYGFDPDEEECARLNQLAAERSPRLETYVPAALGSTSETVTLYETKQPACSSIYPPLESLVRTVPVLAEDIVTVAEHQVTLRTLDDWCADQRIDHIDALKVDTQGSELGVLQGAAEMLRTVLWVEVEVEFNPIYDGQPLFGDVDAHLRSQGFVLWRFGQLVHYADGGPMSSAATGIELNYEGIADRAPGGAGQLYWGMAYYVRSDLAFTSGATSDPAAARRLAALAYAAGFPDLALSVDPTGPVSRLLDAGTQGSVVEPVTEQAGPGNVQARQVARLRKKVERLTRELEEVRSSTTWKVGRAVVAPMARLRRR